MKRLLVALAALVAVVPPPAANAGGASRYAGDCSFAAVEVDAATGAYQGAVYGAFVLYANDPGGNPVSGTVRCEIRLNGTPAAWAGAHGTAVVPVLGDVAFTATDSDWVDLCTVVDYDDDTPTLDECRPSYPLPFPPPTPWDYVDALVTALFVDHVDPVLCEAFRGLPDVPGVVEVNEEGDVYVFDGPFWDCPPYDIWPSG